MASQPLMVSMVLTLSFALIFQTSIYWKEFTFQTNIYDFLEIENWKTQLKVRAITMTFERLCDQWWYSKFDLFVRKRQLLRSFNIYWTKSIRKYHTFGARLEINSVKGFHSSPIEPIDCGFCEPRSANSHFSSMAGLLRPASIRWQNLKQ